MQTHNPLPGLRGIAPVEVLTRQATARLQPRLGSPARDQLIAAAKDAARALHLRGAPRTILEKLVSAYGGTPVNGEIIVWPSNAWLANQTGLDHATIRRAVTRLIQHGLIIPRDSPRRYRFARRDRATGTIVDAYGFILSPLIHKHPEFSGQLLAGEIARRDLNALDDDISRTAIAIRTDLAAALPFDSCGKAMPLQTRFNELAASLPRRGKPGE